jgi:hypothetical protein
MDTTEACFREWTEKNPRLAKQVGLFVWVRPPLGKSAQRSGADSPVLLCENPFIKNTHKNFVILLFSYNFPIPIYSYPTVIVC